MGGSIGEIWRDLGRSGWSLALFELRADLYLVDGADILPQEAFFMYTGVNLGAGVVLLDVVLELLAVRNAASGATRGVYTRQVHPNIGMRHFGASRTPRLGVDR